MNQALLRVVNVLRSGGAVVLLLVLFFVVVASAQAQEAPNVTADEVNDVARELWCPLCSGVRLDGCELKACDQMKDEIAIRLAEGEDTASIKNYFVSQYGPQVLGEPPREGFNLLAWILPFVVLLGGGVFLVTRGRQMLQRSPANSTTVDASGTAPQTDSDPYAQRLEQELARYD
jgi:cytochrome c-type biogenesis protein CcmH